jgi:hypothetical protein
MTSSQNLAASEMPMCLWLSKTGQARHGSNEGATAINGERLPCHEVTRRIN